MDDLNWERSNPFKAVDLPVLTEALQAYRPGIIISSLHPVAVGCRNSNYVLETGKERLFLRITDEKSNNERRAWQLLRERVRMPELLFEGETGGERFLLYECVEGHSLQRHIAENGGCSAEIAAQAGGMAARMHSLPLSALDGVDVFTPPPFETWFDLFLGNPNAQDALGGALLARVRAMLAREKGAIRAISAMPTVPIHADFRPANMLLDPRGEVYVVDWESFGAGHALGDVGQFFRFRDQFNAAAKSAFEVAYNAEALRPLPESWERLSLLRDLVNPLQMLGRKWDAPRAKADLAELVQAIVCLLEE